MKRLMAMVLKRPRYASAMKPPTNGVSHATPPQFHTLVMDSAVPSCSSLVRYDTRLNAMP